MLMLKNGLVVVAGGLGASRFPVDFWPVNSFHAKTSLRQSPDPDRRATSGGTVARPASSATTPLTTAWPPVGGIGRAVSELKPGGSAEFYDPAIAGRPSHDFRVVSESGFLPAGSEIVVREVAGSRVVVQKKDRNV